jgi:hypothetical protein
MKKEFEEGMSEGRLQMLFTLATELPEFTVNKQVREFLDKPISEVKKYLEMVTKKGEKATMKEILISKKLSELFLGEKKCIR